MSNNKIINFSQWKNKSAMNIKEELLESGDHQGIRRVLGPPDDPKDPELYLVNLEAVEARSDIDQLLRHSYNLDIKYDRVRARIEAVSILDESGNIDKEKEARRKTALDAFAISYMSAVVIDDAEQLEMEIEYIKGEVTNEEARDAMTLKLTTKPEPTLMEALEMLRRKRSQQG